MLGQETATTASGLVSTTRRSNTIQSPHLAFLQTLLRSCRPRLVDGLILFFSDPLRGYHFYPVPKSALISLLGLSPTFTELFLLSPLGLCSPTAAHWTRVSNAHGRTGILVNSHVLRMVALACTSKTVANLYMTCFLKSRPKSRGRALRLLLGLRSCPPRAVASQPL